MDLQRLSIGQMAELNHVTIQTLRLYDRQNLLKPQMVDEASGYRYYHITQSARLDLIQNMKMYGMTLAQIGEALEENKDAAALQALLEKQACTVDKRIQQLISTRNAIRRTIDNYKKYEAMPKDGEIFLEYIPGRKIFTYRCSVNYFDQDETGYEYMLRELKRVFSEKQIPASYFSNIGTIIRKPYLQKGELFADEVFLTVDDDAQFEGLEDVPANAYLCLCSGQFSEEENNINKLLAEVKEKRYEIVGDYLCEVIIDFPILDLNRREMIYKTQIPVKKSAN